jgi:transcriptional regulator with XRE-family HTH domain
MAIKITKLKQSIGGQIRALRAAAGLSQMDLAIKLGTAPANVSFWETGRTLPDSAYMEKICDEFDVALVFKAKKTKKKDSEKQA